MHCKPFAIAGETGWTVGGGAPVWLDVAQQLSNGQGGDRIEGTAEAPSCQLLDVHALGQRFRSTSSAARCRPGCWGSGSSSGSAALEQCGIQACSAKLVDQYGPHLARWFALQQVANECSFASCQRPSQNESGHGKPQAAPGGRRRHAAAGGRVCLLRWRRGLAGGRGLTAKGVGEMHTKTSALVLA